MIVGGVTRAAENGHLHPTSLRQEDGTDRRLGCGADREAGISVIMIATDVPASHWAWPNVGNQLKAKLWGVAER